MKNAKFLNLLLTICMILTLSPTVFAVSPEQTYTTVIIHGSPSSSEIATVSNATNELSITALNLYTPDDVENLDLVLLEESALISLDKAVAKSILSAGGILSVETSDTDATLTALYNLLDEEKDLTIEYSGVSPLGVFVSMRNGYLIPGIITKGTLQFADGTEFINPAASTTVSQSSNLSDIIDINDFISHVQSARNTTPPTTQPAGDSAGNTRMAPTNFDNIFDNYTSLSSTSIGSASMGSIFITQYIYDICSYKDGAYTVDIFDVVSHVVVDAGELSYVKNYDVKIRTSNSIIDQTYLNSNSNSSISITGGFSADTDKIISGSAEINTTYTYDTNNQTVTNNFVNTKYNIWSSDPTKNWVDSSWVLEPGVRIKNSNATRTKNSAYTSVSEAAFYWHFMGAQTGTQVYSTPLEVGGSW